MVRKFLIYVIFILFLCSCVTTAQGTQEKQKQDSSNPTDAAFSNDNGGNNENVPTMHLLGGWEDLSPNNKKALEYYSKIRKAIIESKKWQLSSKPDKIASQVVAGKKYNYLADAIVSGTEGRADITIWVRLDDNIEIMECNFIPNK